jgi:hypothetical protein
MAKKNEIQVSNLDNPIARVQVQFEVEQQLAQMYVQSTLIPQHFRGNIGNCVIAIDMAMRLQANPLMVMQNLYVVNGNPAWSSKFLISCINSCGRFTPLRYEFYGKRDSEQYGCRAVAYERTDTERKNPLCDTWVTKEMARKEGWSTKGGSKWNSMPDQMLVYRAAAFWCRVYAPEITMGIMTKEEIEDNVVEDAVVLSEFVDNAKSEVEEIKREEQKAEVKVETPKTEQAPEPVVPFTIEPRAEKVIIPDGKPTAPADVKSEVSDAISRNKTLFN